MAYDFDGFGQQKFSSCPLCRAQLVRKKGPYGWFYGCSRYPRCKFTCHEDQYAPFGSEEAPQAKLWALVHTQCDYPKIVTRPRVFSHKAKAKAALKREVADYARLHEYRPADVRIADDGCSAESDDGMLHWSLHECWLNTEDVQETG